MHRDVVMRTIPAFDRVIEQAQRGWKDRRPLISFCQADAMWLLKVADEAMFKGRAGFGAVRPARPWSNHTHPTVYGI